ARKTGSGRRPHRCPWGDWPHTWVARPESSKGVRAAESTPFEDSGRATGNGCFFCHLANTLGNAHRAELRSAHRTKLGGLEHLLGQRLIVHGPGRIRIE